MDSIDDFVANYVIETWMKDELSSLLKDEPLDETDEVGEEA